MIKVPKAIQNVFSDVVWNIPSEQKILYFTFDDGPTPNVTDKVLAVLKKYNAKATFFCLGNQVEDNKELYQAVLNEGHSVGNHTYNHLKGWKVKNKDYFLDIENTSASVDSDLFRPPYGKMKWSQYKELKKKFKIVLWDVIPEDYLKSMTVNKLVKNVVNNVKSGSIIVLHDSQKCAEVMLGALPVILEKLAIQGYQFKAINRNTLADLR